MHGESPPLREVAYMGAEKPAQRMELAVAFDDPVRTPVLHFCSASIQADERRMGEGLVDAQVLHVGRRRRAALPFRGYAGE
eukprot:8490529-Pyramimonas_sp.AAC.1